MILRRLFALLTTITMLHLTVVTGASACAMSGTAAVDRAPSGDVPHHAAASGHDAGSESAVVTTGSSVDEPPLAPCHAPTQGQCCDAMAGCAVNGLLSTPGGGLASAPRAAARILAAVTDAPASFASAPEPPPPKA